MILRQIGINLIVFLLIKNVVYAQEFYANTLQRQNHSLNQLTKINDESCLDVANIIMRLSRSYRQVRFQHEMLKLQIPLYQKAPQCYAQFFPTPDYAFTEVDERISSAIAMRDAEALRNVLQTNLTLQQAKLSANIFYANKRKWYYDSFQRHLSHERFFNPLSYSWEGEINEKQMERYNKQLAEDSKDISCNRSADSAFSFVKARDKANGHCFEQIKVHNYEHNAGVALRFFEYPLKYDLSKIPSWGQEAEEQYYGKYYALCNEEENLENKLRREIQNLLSSGVCNSGYELVPKTPRVVPIGNKKKYVTLSEPPSVDLLDNRIVIETFEKIHGTNSLAYIIADVARHYRDLNHELKKMDSTVIERLRRLNPEDTIDLSLRVSIPDKNVSYQNYLPISKDIIRLYLEEKEKLDNSYKEALLIQDMRHNTKKFLKKKDGGNPEDPETVFIFQKWQRKK